MIYTDYCKKIDVQISLGPKVEKLDIRAIREQFNSYIMAYIVGFNKKRALIYSTSYFFLRYRN